METNDKLNPRLDEQARRDTEGMIRSGRSTRSDESLDAEPVGEDQVEVDRAPGGEVTGGIPPGMSPIDVTQRAEVARFLGKEVWPADSATLVEQARGLNAPDSVIDQLTALPQGEVFENLNQAWEAIGHQVETRRT